MSYMNNLSIEQQEKIENKEFKEMMQDLGLVTLTKDKLISLLKLAFNHNNYDISFLQWLIDNKIKDL